MNILGSNAGMLPLLMPLIVLQLILQAVALVDLYKRETVTGNKKWAWILVIIFGGILGAAIYFIFGRKDS